MSKEVLTKIGELYSVSECAMNTYKKIYRSKNKGSGRLSKNRKVKK